MTEANTEKKPTSFADLDEKELAAAAAFYGTDVKDTPIGTVADLIETGVNWDLYVSDFLAPEDGKKEENAVEPVDKGVIKAADALQTEPEPEYEIITKPQHSNLAKEQRYLIKMERENPSFEFGRYRFTQANPYALMEAKDANEILTQEDNFRQAHPSEVEEFYA